MKKEYLQQFEELNEEELSELIDDLTEIWHIKHNKEEEVTKENELQAMEYEKDKDLSYNILIGNI